MSNQPKALSLRPDSLAPQTAAGMWGLAEHICKGTLVPDALRGKPYDIMIVMAYGAELGIGPMAALSQIYVVQGKPQMSAALMIALVRRSGLAKRIECTEATAERATWRATRRDDGVEHTSTFTMADAQRAGLANKGPWKQYPARMLSARALSYLVRDHFGDALGYVRTFVPGELDHDEDAIDVEPMPAAGTAEQHAPEQPDDNAAIEIELLIGEATTVPELDRVFARLQDYRGPERDRLDVEIEAAYGRIGS